jgi:hypothetical protein
MFVSLVVSTLKLNIKIQALALQKTDNFYAFICIRETT